MDPSVLAFSREMLSNGISWTVNLAGMRRVLYLRDGLLYLGGSLWQRYQTDRAWDWGEEGVPRHFFSCTGL